MDENNNNTENASNKMNPILIGGIVVAVLIIGAVVVLGMGASNTSDGTELATATSQPTVRPSPTALPTGSAQGASTSASVKTFNLEGKNFRFTPNEIKVNKGDKVKVVLKVADMQHDFVVDGQDVRTKVGKAGETVEVEFTADEAGEFEFYCSVGTHRTQGMVGTLIVE